MKAIASTAYVFGALAVLLCTSLMAGGCSDKASPSPLRDDFGGHFTSASSPVDERGETREGAASCSGCGVPLIQHAAAWDPGRSGLAATEVPMSVGSWPAGGRGSLFVRFSSGSTTRLPFSQRSSGALILPDSAVAFPGLAAATDHLVASWQHGSWIPDEHLLNAWVLDGSSEGLTVARMGGVGGRLTLWCSVPNSPEIAEVLLRW
jgi:hypothetical protein